MATRKYLRRLWAWLRMSRAERAQQRAMATLLSNLLAHAPLDTIAAKKSCTWTMSPEQAVNTMNAVRDYVSAAKAKAGKD